MLYAIKDIYFERFTTKVYWKIFHNFLDIKIINKEPSSVTFTEEKFNKEV